MATPQATDLSGDYVLTVGFFDGSRHALAGETVRLSHEDAQRALEQGVVHPALAKKVTEDPLRILSLDEYMAKAREAIDIRVADALEDARSDYPDYVRTMQERAARAGERDAEDSAPEVAAVTGAPPAPPADAPPVTPNAAPTQPAPPAPPGPSAEASAPAADTQATAPSAELTPPAGAELGTPAGATVGDPSGAEMTEDELEAATAPAPSTPPAEGKKRGGRK